MISWTSRWRCCVSEGEESGYFSSDQEGAFNNNRSCERLTNLAHLVCISSFGLRSGPAVVMATPAHLSKVRSLYKRILVLHRFLPVDLKSLGDQYVKDEFRRHKRAAEQEVNSFMKEWEVKNNKLIQHSQVKKNKLHSLQTYRVKVVLYVHCCVKGIAENI